MHREKWQHCLPFQLPKMPRLEGTLKDHLVYPSTGKGTQMRLSGPLSNQILKTPGDGDSTTSLGRLFQLIIVLTVNNSFLILTWNLSPWNLYPCGSLGRERLHPLSFCPISAGILGQGAPWAFSSPGTKELSP